MVDVLYDLNELPFQLENKVRGSGCVVGACDRHARLATRGWQPAAGSPRLTTAACGPAGRLAHAPSQPRAPSHSPPVTSRLLTPRPPSGSP